jgi:hypothetical protein
MSAEWYGSVVEVWEDGDTFTATAQRGGHPEFVAEFRMSQCGISVEPGDLLIITPGRVTVREPRAWTAAELAEIMQRARERSRRLRLNVD